jgi:hypothetical protein
MRNGHFVLAIAAVLTGYLVSTANALQDCPLTADNYVCRTPCYSDGTAKCYHRTFSAFGHCVDRENQRCAAGVKPQELVSAETVNTAISCALVDARKRTKGKTVDLSKARTITEDLTFTLVSNNGIGGSLAFGIPVYPGVSVGPSLSDLNSVTDTSQITNSFTIPRLDDLNPKCTNITSRADWLDYVIVSPDPGQTLSRLTVGVEFYVSKSNNDSLNINIFAVKIGPQFTNENDKTQKACLTFDFEKPPVGADGKPVEQDNKQAGQQDGSKQTSASACQLGSSSGGQSKASQ